MNIRIILLLAVFSIGSLSAQEEKKQEKTTQKIEWLSFEEAVKRNETEPKKFIIDVWTTWCGWCKRMDATTFSDPVIIEYINQNYHAVKLNAERIDTVIVGGNTFINENPTGRRSPHQLAISLLNGKMSYPSIVYLDENVNMLQPLSGYQDAKSIEPVLHFFSENAYKTIKWPDFQATFKSQLPQKIKKSELN